MDLLLWYKEAGVIFKKKIIIKWRWGYGKFFISTQCGITHIFYNDIRFFAKKT